MIEDKGSLFDRICNFLYLGSFIIILAGFGYYVALCGYKQYQRHSYMEKLGCQKVEYYNDVPSDWKEAIHDYRCPPNVDPVKASYGRPE